MSACNGDITLIIIDKLCAEFEITINHVYRKVSLDCSGKMAIVTVAKRNERTRDSRFSNRGNGRRWAGSYGFSMNGVVEVVGNRGGC